jgi:hypothetical protein
MLLRPNACMEIGTILFFVHVACIQLGEKGQRSNKKANLGTRTRQKEKRMTSML